MLSSKSVSHGLEAYTVNTEVLFTIYYYYYNYYYYIIIIIIIIVLLL